MLNPYSGSGKSNKILKWLKEKLKGDRYSYFIEILEKGKSIRENLLRLWEKKVSKIIVLGGDGTLFHIINNIPKNFNIPFSLFPSGSGNDFIKTIFRNKKDISFFYEVFKRGIIKSTYTGEVITKNKRYFFVNAAGIGFDAKIAKRALKIRSLRGLLRYLLSLFIELRGKISYEMEIEDREKVLKGKYLILGLGIGKYLGGGFYLFPDASPFDNKLSICIIKDMDKINVFKKLPHAIKGTHLSLPECIYFKRKDINLKLKEEIFIQLDGEVFKLKDNEIKAKISDIKFNLLYI
ncbi:MAG: YegS/Rv2252/BmrU family lipid kinase [candidate division WOR-3 bacterium]